MRKDLRAACRTALAMGVLCLAAAASLNLTSCTPGAGISAQESDVILTRYDTEADFGAFTTFAMPDSIVHIVEEGEESDLSREYDEEMLALIAANFEARGFERVPEDNPTAPDFVVIVQATSIEYWRLYSYYPYYPGWGWWPGWGWYPGWGPGWGGYYPPYYGGSYAFTTGTLFVDMTDPEEAEEDPEDGDILVPVYWQGVINGVLDDAKSSKRTRINDSINQLFIQSPYLATRE